MLECSKLFAEKFMPDDRAAMGRVLFDHITNNGSDVITNKLHIPTAIFTGTKSNSIESQHWSHAQITGSKLFIFTEDEHGDHFLHFKNPQKFCSDLSAFLTP